jgi:hypothetical protein
MQKQQDYETTDGIFTLSILDAKHANIERVLVPDRPNKNQNCNEKKHDDKLIYNQKKTHSFSLPWNRRT